MALDEQRATAKAFNGAHHFPGMLLVLDRIGTDHSNGVVTQVAGGPDRPEFRIDEVGATARMRYLTHVNRGGQLVGLEVDHRDLVGGVGGVHEVAVCGVQSTVDRKSTRL